MDYKAFYRQLFAPLEATIGPIDPYTIVAIMGFDGGGPLNFCTIGVEDKKPFITYVSCELAVRPEQQPSDFGRYELLAHCDDELWVRSIVSNIGRMTLNEVFGDGDTLDIGPCVAADAPLQGAVFEKFCTVEIDGEQFAVFRVIGITRPEMEYAQEHGSSELLARLREAGVYPNTAVGRKSVL